MGDEHTHTQKLNFKPSIAVKQGILMQCVIFLSTLHKHLRHMHGGWWQRSLSRCVRMCASKCVCVCVCVCVCMCMLVCVHSCLLCVCVCVCVCTLFALKESLCVRVKIGSRRS